jgi:glycosyltransferase involved in cell wall biosynthesis
MCLFRLDGRYLYLFSAMELISKSGNAVMIDSLKDDEKVLVSVVFPAYNEVQYLQEAVEKTSQTLGQFTNSYEIIIAEDGSTDGTPEKSEELAKKYQFVRHIHGEERLGRGGALSGAFRQSRGEVLIDMDLDLATDLKYLKPLVETVTVEGYDFVTGSRLMSESKVKRAFRRSLSSKSYNFLVRHVLGSKLHDHQCGFKAFKREPALAILDKVKARHWFWDTEILVRGQREGYRIKEIPVEWKSGDHTKVHLFKDSCGLGLQVFKFWWQHRRE